MSCHPLYACQDSTKVLEDSTILLCFDSDVLGPAVLDHVLGMSVLSVKLNPNTQKCPLFCAACS
jgi:hypothetical protein